MFVFAQRSKENATPSSNGQWTCAAVETMSVLDKHIPARTAVRGLNEEVGLGCNDEEVELVIAYMKTDTHECGMGAIVDYRRRKQSISGPPAMFTETVKQRWQLASDKKESLQLAFVPFQCHRMARWMMRHQLSTATPAIAITALCREFGVEAALDAFSVKGDNMNEDDGSHTFQVPKRPKPATTAANGASVAAPPSSAASPAAPK